MNTRSGNSLIDVALSSIVVVAEQVGKVKAMLALAPRLEAADALAEAMQDILGQGDGNPLYTSWGERVDDAAALATLAAYDAARKGEANG